jgi:hypothetical protein
METDEQIIQHACEVVRAWWEDDHPALLLSFRKLAESVHKSGRLEQTDLEEDE